MSRELRLGFKQGDWGVGGRGPLSADEVEGMSWDASFCPGKVYGLSRFLNEVKKDF